MQKLGVRVATLNVWALPLGLAPRSNERMRAITKLLGRREEDVWGFQEVWTQEAREVLVAGALAAGYRVAEAGGGLLVASRIPFRDATFQPYTLRGIATHVHRGDHASGKGFQRLTLDTSAGPVALFNTHLHAQYVDDRNDPFSGHRMGQIVELAHAMGPIAEPLIALGDFNIRENTRHYEVLMGLAGLEDAAVALDQREPTSSSGSRIDLVLTRGPRPRHVEILAARGIYSDHAGVRARLELAPGRSAQPDPSAVAYARTSLARGRRRAERRLREERALAVTGAVVGAGSLVAMRQTRRRFLLGALAALSLPAAAIYGLSATRFIPDELRSYDAVSKLL